MNAPSFAVLLEKPERVLVGVHSVPHACVSLCAMAPEVTERRGLRPRHEDACFDPSSARSASGHLSVVTARVSFTRATPASLIDGTRVRAREPSRCGTSRRVVGTPKFGERFVPSQESNTLTPRRLERETGGSSRDRPVRTPDPTDWFIHRDHAIHPSTKSPNARPPGKKPRFFWPTTAMKLEAMLVPALLRTRARFRHL